ncbi:MAG: nucleotide exchange factor GrpE [Clostridiales bacterium]|jgi:molecular chaperone GrpE|nr:nucleotide exchange factor GrpE [Clostridiales bacterium]
MEKQDLTDNELIQKEPAGNQAPAEEPELQPGPDGGKAKKKDKKRDKQEAENLIESLTTQRDENMNRYLRAMAEFDNFRKRTASEKAVMYDAGIRDAVTKILPVLDNFQRAMAAVSEDNQVTKGFVMILKQLNEALAAMGVEEIAAVGTAFDPNLHDAVMHIDDEAFGPSEVVEELQKGYKCKDKVIRYSMVKVAN